jgi:hypothetical protein
VVVDDIVGFQCDKLTALVANHANLGLDLRDFNGDTKATPEINLPTGIMAPDQSDSDEKKSERTNWWLWYQIC